MTRRLILHIGVHKTASTYLQQHLLSNRQLLAAEGILVPVTASNGGAMGHHNLSYGMRGDLRYRHYLGTFAELVKEINASDAATIIVSSEDFEHTATRPEHLDYLVQLAARVGARLEIVAMVREQISLLNSVYTQQVKQLLDVRAFDPFVAAWHTDRRFWYDRHFREVMKHPDVTFVAVPFSRVKASGPIAAFLEPLALDSSLPARMVVAADAANTALSPRAVAVLQIAGLVLRGNHGDLANPETFQALLHARVARGARALCGRQGWLDDAPFWGWTAPAAQAMAERFARSNRAFATAAWGGAWPDEPPVDRPPNAISVEEMIHQLGAAQLAELLDLMEPAGRGPVSGRGGAPKRG